VLRSIWSVSPSAQGWNRFPLNTVVLSAPMFEAKVDESVFQFADVVDSAMVQVPEFMLVALESNAVL